MKRALIRIGNTQATPRDLSLEAYEYNVDGKYALDGVVERLRVKTDKSSCTVNDADNREAEAMGNAKYLRFRAGHGLAKRQQPVEPSQKRIHMESPPHRRKIHEAHAVNGGRVNG